METDRVNSVEDEESSKRFRELVDLLKNHSNSDISHELKNQKYQLLEKLKSTTNEKERDLIREELNRLANLINDTKDYEIKRR